MTPRDAVSRRITDLCAPYLRIERAPLSAVHEHGPAVRIWFGPDCFVDMDRQGFEDALLREPLPTDEDGRIDWSRR